MIPSSMTCVFTFAIKVFANVCVTSRVVLNTKGHHINVNGQLLSPRSAAMNEPHVSKHAGLNTRNLECDSDGTLHLLYPGRWTRNNVTETI